MSRAGLALALLVAAVAALQLAAVLRPQAAGMLVATCGPCHDGTLTPLPAGP